VSCCKRCNYKKREDGFEDFGEWVRQVYHTRFERG
jgi:hypothetical protein